MSSTRLVRERIRPRGQTPRVLALQPACAAACKAGCAHATASDCSPMRSTDRGGSVPHTPKPDALCSARPAFRAPRGWGPVRPVRLHTQRVQEPCALDPPGTL